MTLSEGLLYIETGAFQGCTALTELVLPDSIETINRKTFAGCDNLRKIVIPEHLERRTTPWKLPKDCEIEIRPAPEEEETGEEEPEEQAAAPGGVFQYGLTPSGQSPDGEP